MFLKHSLKTPVIAVRTWAVLAGLKHGGVALAARQHGHFISRGQSCLTFTGMKTPLAQSMSVFIVFTSQNVYIYKTVLFCPGA